MPTNMGMSLPQTQTPEDLSVWQKIQNGLLGPSQNYGGLLDMQQQKAAQQQGLLSMGTSLLGNSGWSPNRVGTGQALGQALQAGQQGKLQSIDSAMNAALLASQIQKNNRATAVKTPFGTINPSKFTPESLREFQKTGDYGQLNPVANANIGKYNPGEYTPESFSAFLQSGNVADLQRYVPPATPTVQVVNGVPTAVQPSRTGAPPVLNPLSTQDTEIEAARRKAEEEARAKARGTIAGEAEGTIQKKGSAAANVNAILDIAEPIIDLSTGSKIGAGADKVAAFFGKSLDGAQAAAQLQILQAGLMFAQPRMEGPQGVLDVQLYEKAAGQLGDSNVPAATKKAAVKTIRALQAKYKEAAAGAESNQSNIQQLLDKYAPQK